MFNILANSDASYATAAKKDAAAKMDLKARGIKPGEGFSISSPVSVDLTGPSVLEVLTMLSRG